MCVFFLAMTHSHHSLSGLSGTCLFLAFSASVRLHGHETSVAVAMMPRGWAAPGMKEQAREGSALSSHLPMAVTLAGHFAVQHVTVRRFLVRLESDSKKKDGSDEGGAGVVQLTCAC